MGSVTVRLDAFEGPFDLLFHLIEKNKIDIYDIPIAELTEQYLTFLEQAERKDMDEMSQFLVMAATLLEIKSKMLLPKVKNQEQEEDEPDPREELVEKLLEYRKFKKITESFKEREDIWGKRLFKEIDTSLMKLTETEKNLNPAQSLQGITMADIYHAFEEVMRRKQIKTDTVRSSFQRVTKDRFTIQERMEYIRDLLMIQATTTFDSIFHKDAVKIEIVVTFLALLEMMKQREIILTQKNNFDAIIIQKAS